MNQLSGKNYIFIVIVVCVFVILLTIFKCLYKSEYFGLRSNLYIGSIFRQTRN